MADNQTRRHETHAYVLSVVTPRNFGRGPKGEVVIQAIGEAFLTLLELAPVRNTRVRLHERVSLERNKEGSKIDHVVRRIAYKDLSPEAAAELPFVVEMIVTKHEQRYVQFFNESQPITTRLHSLQLLPGIGPTLMWSILEERKKEPFKSFDDIAARTKLQNPKKTVTARILEELQDDVKRWLFTRPPPTDEEREHNRNRTR
ncbi:MAG: DUF655 domain-containing protein [Candidatus Thorarchaeota archaeon]